MKEGTVFRSTNKLGQTYTYEYGYEDIEGHVLWNQDVPGDHITVEDEWFNQREIEVISE